MPDGIQLRRTDGWRLRRISPNAVNVARPTIWGNPWKVVDGLFVEHLDGEYSAYLTPEGAAASAVDRYRKWLLTGFYTEKFTLPAIDIEQLGERRSEMIDRLSELRGRDLACWCAPDAPCHRDALLELANGSAWVALMLR